MIRNNTFGNTDNKINRFVTFFALAFRYLDNMGKLFPAGAGQVVTLFAFAPATPDKFVMSVAPGHA
jgi:hypothetical protein